MVVVVVRRRLIARAPVAKLVALEDPGFLEQANGAVYGRDRNLGIDRRCALVKRLDVGMILRLAQHARDGAALLGDAQALVGAQLFDVDLAVHGAWLVGAAPSVKV